MRFIFKRFTFNKDYINFPALLLLPKQKKFLVINLKKFPSRCYGVIKKRKSVIIDELKTLWVIDGQKIVKINNSLIR